VQLSGKDVGTYLAIATALVSGVAAFVDSRARGEFNSAQVQEVKAELADVRQEGRVTREMAVETRSQTAQILAAVTRVESKLDASLVARAAPAPTATVQP
jgi:hypothetical protein